MHLQWQGKSGLRTEERSGRKGLSLIEVMVAVTVMTIAILGTIGAQTMSRELAATSRDTNRAVADLRAAMEEVLLLSIDEIPDADGPYAPGVSIDRFEDLHLNDQSIVATYPNYAGGPVPDPLQVVLECRWSDHAGRDRSISIACVKTR